jgi:lysozyme
MKDVRTQVVAEEGVVYSAYLDSLGYWTLGVGFLIDRRKGGVIPQPVLDYWLDFEIDKRRRALRAALPWFDRLDDVRKSALLNMAYQLGVDGLLAFSKALARIRDERWEDAKTELLDSIWAKQTPERAKRMAEQIRTGEWQFPPQFKT